MWGIQFYGSSESWGPFSSGFMKTYGSQVFLYPWWDFFYPNYCTLAFLLQSGNSPVLDKAFNSTLQGSSGMVNLLCHLSQTEYCKMNCVFWRTEVAFIGHAIPPSLESLCLQKTFGMHPGASFIHHKCHGPSCAQSQNIHLVAVGRVFPFLHVHTLRHTTVAVLFQAKETSNAISNLDLAINPHRIIGLSWKEPLGSPHPTNIPELNAENNHQLQPSLQPGCFPWHWVDNPLTPTERICSDSKTSKCLQLCSLKRKSSSLFFFSYPICRTYLFSLCFVSQVTGCYDFRNVLQ